MSVSADFSAIPDAFVQAYVGALLSWANHVSVNPTMTIELRDATSEALRRAGLPATKVTLVAQPWRHPVSGDVRIVVTPLSEMDGELIRKHCEELPKLRQARSFDPASLEQGVGWRFERVGDAFLEAYEPEIRKWGRNFKGIGRSCPIMLRRPHGMKPVLDDNGEETMLMVQLFADRVERVGERLQIVAVPETERDETLIAKHSEDLVRYGAPIKRRIQ